MAWKFRFKILGTIPLKFYSRKTYILSLLLSDEYEVRDQDAQGLNRFAVIKYLHSEGKWVYSARRYHNQASSYICQLQQQGLLKLFWVHWVTEKNS